MRVLWTDEALARLEAIRDHVAQDSPTAAVRLVSSLVDRGESLSRLSRRGRLLPGREREGLRELMDGNYRIVYRVGDGAVEVLTVFERHRLLPEEDLP